MIPFFLLIWFALVLLGALCLFDGHPRSGAAILACAFGLFIWLHNVVVGPL